jgi:hypothetical protein
LALIFDQSAMLSMMRMSSAPPGHYVLAGQYDHGSGYGTFREVTVTAGANLRVDMPNVCQ